MECLQVSPCMGWMSADPERRARTTKREQELSQAAEELVNEQKGLRIVQTQTILFLNSMFEKVGSDIERL